MKFTNNTDIKRKSWIDYFGKFETIDEEELNDLLKILNYKKKRQCYHVVWSVEKREKIKTYILQKKWRKNNTFIKML